MCASSLELVYVRFECKTRITTQSLNILLNILLIKYFVYDIIVDARPLDIRYTGLEADVVILADGKQTSDV